MATLIGGCTHSLPTSLLPSARSATRSFLSLSLSPVILVPELDLVDSLPRDKQQLQDNKRSAAAEGAAAKQKEIREKAK